MILTHSSPSVGEKIIVVVKDTQRRLLGKHNIVYTNECFHMYWLFSSKRFVNSSTIFTFVIRIFLLYQFEVLKIHHIENTQRITKTTVKNQSSGNITTVCHQKKWIPTNDLLL